MTAYLATVTIPPFNGDFRYRGFTKTPLFGFRSIDQKSFDYRDYQIKLFDADQDGYTDIVSIYGKQDGLKWMRQLSGMRIEGPVNLLLPAIKSPDAFDIQDMNNDGIRDIVINSQVDKALYMYLAKK
jgi:hypothetical protein